MTYNIQHEAQDSAQISARGTKANRHIDGRVTLITCAYLVMKVHLLHQKLDVRADEGRERVALVCPHATQLPQLGLLLVCLGQHLWFGQEKWVRFTLDGRGKHLWFYQEMQSVHALMREESTSGMDRGDALSSRVDESGNDGERAEETWDIKGRCRARKGRDYHPRSVIAGATYRWVAIVQ